MKRISFAAAVVFLFSASVCLAGNLKVVTVGAPAVNYVFSPDGKIYVSDTSAPVPIGNQKGFFQSRTFYGKSGSPAHGLYGNAYRIDLRNTSGTSTCIQSVTFTYRQLVTSLDYNGDNTADDVYVVTKGGLGSVGLTSAYKYFSGKIKFTFSQPVCSGTSTYFFELASKYPSVPATATLKDTNGNAYSIAVRAPMPSVSDLSTWLNNHSNVRNAIKWQNQPANPGNAYTPPTNANKIAWSNWSQSQKDDLNQAYLDTCAWFFQGAHQVSMDPNGLTDTPTNVHPNVSNDGVTAMQDVTPDYMWKLYIAHIAFSLALETNNKLPWSITSYDNLSLKYLFDSSTMAWNLFNTRYDMGVYALHVPVKREDNRPKTGFAPPKWTYPFLKQSNLVGSTRIETITNVLEWMRQNMAHFMGAETFGNMNAVWQYRGFPPISRIIHGTVDSNYPGMGLKHWTAGCHGSVGFLNGVLRTVNIPVEPVWICGHELPYFITEKMYMDHGDDPYNQNVKNSGVPMLEVLIDEPTYQSWFTNDLTVNITDNASPACANIGRRAKELGP